MSKRDAFFRGRRLRSSQGLRELVRETELRPQDLIQPYFVLESEDKTVARPIDSMPGQNQLGLEALKKRVKKAAAKGLRGLILFGIPEEKDEVGSQAYAEDGVVQMALRELKEEFPEIILITDVCLCEYTSHGHCGLVKDKEVQNDPSLELLAKTAVSHARAGADIVAPSDMMDGRVLAIRLALDEEGFENLPILSYAVKYASKFYGPFRDAAQSAPGFGDRKTYQMDPGNAREGLLEARADLNEGADMLMVKPALPYLDVLKSVRQEFDLPLAAYQVSGEYAMLKSAAELGRLEEMPVVLESLNSIKRAGADLILTYYAEEVLDYFS